MSLKKKVPQTYLKGEKVLISEHLKFRFSTKYATTPVVLKVVETGEMVKCPHCGKNVRVGVLHSSNYAYYLDLPHPFSCCTSFKFFELQKVFMPSLYTFDEIVNQTWT